MKMQAKTITIRVSSAEFATLSAQAEEQKTSATRYATTLVKSGLQGRLEEDRLAAVRVVDGDTLDVLVANRPVRVRLAQIDAPERRQAYGTRARQALSAMTFRRVVSVADAGVDGYGRQLGTVLVGGQNINAAMVDRGMAWAYRQYLTDRSLIRLEQQARAARRGLWSDPAPVAPWRFRAHHFP